MRSFFVIPTIATVIEWTSFFSVGILSAIYLTRLFGLFIAFLVFFSGFVGRPLGAILFGSIGDKFGRKPAISLIILFLAIANLGIFSFNFILVIISVVLLGLSLGGEWSSSAVIVAENSRFRAFWISFVQIGVPIGLFFSSLFALNRYLYLFVSIISLSLLLLSFKISETPLFLELKGTKKKLNPFSALELRKIITGITIKLGESSVFYFFASFSIAYLGILDFKSATIFLLITAIEQMFLMILFGHFTDIMGRENVSYIGFFFMAVSILTFGLFIESRIYQDLIISYLLFGIGDSAVYTAQGAILTELFRTESRTISTGIAYQLSAVISGGITSLLLSLNHSLFSIITIPIVYIILSVFGLHYMKIY